MVLAKNVFATSKDDNKPGQSIEDLKLASIMETQMTKNADGNWEAPLPFRNPVSELPDNRGDTLKRFNNTKKMLQRKPDMKKHYHEFMGKLLDHGHAEPVPNKDLNSNAMRWYLPQFGVYHPLKPGKIRVVFDSAAETSGVSLNKMLLSGPDLTNSLIGILLRFRIGPVAFTVDIEQMFHSFFVSTEHRDFLRFFWHKENDPNKEVVEHRMKVHLFGNTSSPAVATTALRLTARTEERNCGTDAREFVERDFYVDDGLKSAPNCEEAVNLLKRTQQMLATANLRLHKVASNKLEVTRAFSEEDRATDLRNLDLHDDIIPVQRSLGVSWDLQNDALTFQVVDEEKPFTRRGVLSTTNSLYDPLGIAAPVVIKAKMLLRTMTTSLQRHPLDVWDKPLPNEFRQPWEVWRSSLAELKDVMVPRSYTTTSLSEAKRIEIHTFGDASEEAIAAVAFLKIVQDDDTIEVSFLFGKAKLAPSHATTIPRLELCAAVLAVEITEMVLEELPIKPTSVTYYSDSKVTLGYILSETRRFYVYVANRVQRIRKSSSPHQWRYVATDCNQADLATSRSIEARYLKDSAWLNGPKFLRDDNPRDSPKEYQNYEPPATDPEVRPSVTTLLTSTEPKENKTLETTRFLRFSRWTSLVKGVSRLIQLAQKLQHRTAGEETEDKASIVEVRRRAQMFIISNVQSESFKDEIRCLKIGKKLPKSSPLTSLKPTIDPEGILRVGGRLHYADTSFEERHPIIIPAKHHIAKLIVENCHVEVKHQGRHFTHGMVRGKGFWIIGEKHLINRVIHECLTCRKLRGKFQQQRMADLPAERLHPSPPFTNIGIDVFGPWNVLARRTRGGHASSKRWAVLFTCLATRAVHTELVESMDTSSFFNALRRFMAIKGPVKLIRSDCGTNFVGAHNEFKAALSKMDKNSIESYLASPGCTWEFNPPHASHMGGVWERMIGICRRILDSILLTSGITHLTHEALSTFLAELSAIVNNRPLVAVPNDPSAPEILTSAALLTQKTQPLLAAPGKFVPKDLYTKQWRQVQCLADRFWSRWKREYLSTLQCRRKWKDALPNLEVGDLVLLRCKESPRNNWPIGLISKTIKGSDGKVRRVEVSTAKNNSRQTYERPVSEVVLLKRQTELDNS